MNENLQVTEPTKQCPKCKELISRDAKKCRYCGSDLRNWFIRHKIMTGILALLLLGIILGVAGKSNSSKNNPIPTALDTKGQAANKINDTVSVGQFSYKVVKAEQKKTVGNQYVSQTADGTYEIVSLVLRNNDKEFRYADSNMFKLLDDAGRSFVVSTEATTAYSMANGNSLDFFLKQANPGVEIPGVLIFDIPTDAKSLKLEVSGSFGSPEKAYIELQ